MTVLTITRPADTTQYAQGDLIATSTTAADAIAALPYVEPGVQSVLHSITLAKQNTNVTDAAFRVWVLDSAPALSNGDNGAVAGIVASQVVGIFEGVVASGDVYLSAFTAVDLHDVMALKEAGTIGEEAAIIFTPRKVVLQRQRYYFVLEARDAYIPASAEVFNLRLNLEPCF